MDVYELTREQLRENEILTGGMQMLAELPGAHVFAAYDGAKLCGTAVVSAFYYGRGYALNYVDSGKEEDVVVYGLLLDAVEDFCREKETPDLKCGLFSEHGEKTQLYALMEQRGYISIAKDGYYLAYRLDDIRKHELYRAYKEGKLDRLLSMVKTYEALTGDELVDLLERIDASYMDEDLDEADNPYTRYFVENGKTIGFLDMRQLQPGIIMMQDVFRDESEEVYVVPALLAGVLKALDEEDYENPALLLPIMFPGMYKGVKVALGEPKLEYRFHTYIKKIDPIMEDIEENGQFRLVMIEQPELYDRFAPLFAENLDYRTSDYIVIGAVDTQQNIPAGVIAVSDTQQELVIEYLYVAKEYRGQSVGTLLFEEIKQLAMEADSVPMEIECSFDMDNDDLLKFFFKRSDITMAKHGETYIVSPEEIGQSPFMKKLSTMSVGGDTSVAACSQSKEYICGLLADASKDGRINDFSGMDVNLSQIRIVDDKVKAVVLLDHSDGDYVEVSYIMCADDSCRPELFTLMAHALAAYKRMCPGKPLRMRIVDRAIEINKVFPGIESAGGICVARWNYN